MVAAEAYRNLIAVGATPPCNDRLLKLWFTGKERNFTNNQLIQLKACLKREVLNTPVVSGNVSLYNETRGTSIFPTPVVGMVGLIEDINYLNDFHPKAGENFI